MGFDEDNGSPLFQRKSPVDLNTKIMIAAIISLTTVIFVLALLHLYARSRLSRQEHQQRRTAIQRLLIAVAASRAPPKTGLHPSVIAALPASVFMTAEGNEIIIECSVCLSVVQEGETVRTLRNCHHTFHAECIDKWFGGQSSCPICRAEAAPRHPTLLTPEPRESAVRAVGQRATAEGTWTKVRSGSMSSIPLSFFRKMLGREIVVSCRLVQSCEGEVVQDLERQ